MSGCLEQRWVSCAEDDGEAWKCLLLSRALKRTLTTRPLVVICSESVSRPMGRRLQEEVSQLWWVDPKEWEGHGVTFASYAKVVADRLPGLHKTVWLDNSVLPLKNCDALFRTQGVQWVGGNKGQKGQGKGHEGDRAAIFVKSRSMSKEDQQLLTNLVLARENPTMKLKVLNPAGLVLDKITSAVIMDVKSAHPAPLPGKDVRMVAFVQGHPNDLQGGGRIGFEKRGQLETQVLQLVASLLPELHTPKLVNGHGPLTPTSSSSDESGCPWELNNSIAIIGMACRYPCANTIPEFWELLAQGREGIRKVPEGRWTKDKAFIRMDNMSATEAGFLSCPVHTFDAKFFNTNAADMHYLDPQQRLSLRVVWEGLESAGIDPNTLKGSLTGVFGGWWRNDYKEMLQMLGIVDTDFLRGYMGNALGPLTARISHFFELIGPSFSTESGCSTSVAGVDMACDSLRSDACDLAIAVGANLLLHPFSPTVMEGVLAPDGRCKTYDASADGFGRAEGIGVLILKRFGDAVADGDKIWGCIRGSAVVQEGPSKSMGTPTVDVEAKAMSLALERAGVDPDDVEFVETHGTGTPVGDPIEIAAVAKAYSGGVKGRSNILTIGSVKTNIGHTESVCGIAGIQKSVLAMAHETIPQHLHLKTLNPDVNLDAIPARLPLTPMPWKRRSGPGAKPRIAGINSFGITGAQAHVLVQEPPLTSDLPPHSFPFKDSREERILTFSAKSEEAFRAQVEGYAKLLKGQEDIDLNDLEFTMHTGRPHMGLRAVAMGSTKEALLSAMEGLKPKPIPNQTPQLCFLFTGQGSQYPGMAADLYEQNLVFRSNFDWAESVLEKEHGFGLKKALWTAEGAPLLKTSLYSQTSIFVIEFCLLRLWQSWGLTPAAVLGHSLGEFAAAVAAGMMTPKDALTLVVTRSKLINDLPPSSMLVVGAGLDKTMAALDRAFSGAKKWLDIAAVNSEGQTVVSGSTEVVMDFKLYCDNNEIKTTILDASHAFHSRLMDPMLAEYGRVAGGMRFKKGGRKGVTFISGVDGGVVTQLDAAYWVRHTREKVRFLGASHTAVREGCSVFLELGPHPVLSALLSTNVDEIAEVIAFPALRRSHPAWSTTLTSLGSLYSLGLPISWPNFHRYSHASRIPCSLPGYHFEETPYWMGIKDEGATPFHPLLGGAVPNPSSLSIFRSSINVHRLPFLKDHALGDKIIFPCVGYIDMCLTAGYAATSCSSTAYSHPTSPICVRSFSIHSPICLSELSPTEFQVVVDKGQGGSGETTSTIFTRVYLEDGSFKWVKNASATFSNNPPPPTPIASEPFDQIRARCTELVRENFDYRELEEFGFNFGPSCRTVSPGCKNPADGGEWLFPFKSHEREEDHARFIIHPWATDPMLQTQIMALGLLHDTQVRKRLVVPVSVENFTWWGVSRAESGWIHVRHSESGNEAHLYTQDGVRMVSMLGTEFMETTLANILSLIDSQKNPYPSLAEFGWKEKLGAEERRVPGKELGGLDLKELTSGGNATFSKEEALFHERFNGLAGLYMLKAMKELGLEKAGPTFSWPEVTTSLGVLPSLSKFLRYILLELAQDGWLTQGQGQGHRFTLTKALPHLDSIRGQIKALGQTISTAEGGVGLKELESTAGVWAVLGPILTGTTSALPLLFPDGSTTSGKGPAEICYTESLFAMKRYSLNRVESDLLTSLSTLGSKSVVRVLEVGAGVGSETQHLLPAMVAAGGSHFHYTYTDLSPAFLSKGEDLFEESGVNAEFTVLDVERDPSSQGFVPGHYDVIVASWVLHATKRLEDVVVNLKRLLRPGGYLLITELVEPTRAVKLLFGGLEGFWKFEDEALRPWHCELSVKGWKGLLGKEGFKVEALESYEGANALIVAKKGEPKVGEGSRVKVTKEQLGNSWIVFGTKERTLLEERLEAADGHIIKINRPQVTSSSDMEGTITTLLKHAFTDETLNIRGLIYTWGVDPSLTTTEICEPFLYIAKYLVKIQGSLRVVAFTRGNLSTGPSDLFLLPPTASPLIGMVNVLANENMDLICKVVDVDPAPSLTSSSALGDAFSELFYNDLDVMVAFRGHSRSTPRLRPYKVKATPLPIPTSPRYRLHLPPSHLIQDLTFAPCEKETPADLECEVEVKAYALNFLDVLMVTKPDPVFEKYNYLGVDIAGVVTATGPGCTRKVGDRVVIVRRSGPAMPSHIISPDHRTLVIPDDITFSEAATFPMGLLTVATCLVDVAKAGPDDIVLIHTASGGVGLIGIQIAQRLGATVVVTAGNERKRAYLRDHYGVKHVFNSRSTEYEMDIRKALGGRGVTVVMNSLTSPGFKEATLNLCEKGARFVEMSKMNIWSKEDVARLRPDVAYDVVDVSTLSDEKLNELAVYLQGQLLRRKEDRPRPLPYVRFDASEIREALEYMEKVKHVGKIVLRMPDQPGGGGGEQVIPLLNPDSTYMITGGLGGIGLEVAKWMATVGADTFLLLGRSPPSAEALDKIQKLQDSGIRVETRALDVANLPQLEALMEEFKSGALPPLRGIMHAAGILDDATFENQSWEKYEAVFSAKVTGAWNLHQISLSLPFPLEHFVLFSSMTATVGAVAQSNYVAGNQYLDCLAAYRNSLGHPATAINWGQWGGVGLAAHLHVALNKPLSIHQGTAALGHALTCHVRSQLMAHESDLGAYKAVLPSCRGLLADFEEDSGAGGGTEIDGDEFWREYDATATSGGGREEKVEVLRKFLKRLIRLTLKMDRNEEIGDHVAFQDLGMDSLMMVEMKNGLQASVGKRVKISINAVKDCKTVAQLGDRLVELISGKEELPPPSPEELKALVAKDAALPPSIVVDSLLASTLVRPMTAIRTVLVLGSTGTLGPYVIRELLARSHITRVICIMQANPMISPTERFRRVFEKKGLLPSESDMVRIECLVGDIKEPSFGLVEPIYRALAGEVDAVFNLAVKVAFEEIYRGTEDPKSSRITNVTGMRNVLQFGVDGRKLKYVYHASTFAAETRVDDAGHFWEEWPAEEEVARFPNSAYSISKLICDRLAEQAVERGLPCKVFRLPQLGGDSVKGGNVQMESFLMMRCLAYLYTGSMHGASVPLSLMAVDQCAALSVELFFNESAGFEMFNVLNPHLGDEREFETLAREFGVAVKVMESTEFLEKWNALDSKDEMIQLVKFATSKDAVLLHLRDQEFPFYAAFKAGNTKVFHSKKLARLIPAKYPNSIVPSWEVLRRDLRFARDSGVFERFKIKHSNPYLLTN